MLDLTNLEKKCCLTCQYYQGERELVMRGPKMVIKMNNPSQGGNCALGNGHRGWDNPPRCISTCRYKRWIELP